MFPTRVTDDYNSTKCKIQDAEHRIDHLLIAYLKQLNRRLNGEVELGCQPDKNEFFSNQTLENFIISDIMTSTWMVKVVSYAFSKLRRFVETYLFRHEEAKVDPL